MLYPKIALARWVVAYCKAFGIQRIVLSPGSRNAPLLLGFSQDPFFTCVQVVDERSAGFIALGMAQVSQQPAALVCTSGSALANYYPAVLEAHYSNIPLLVLSADRPPYMWERADGQTIVQDHFFGPHIRFSATLPMDDDALPKWYREKINQSIDQNSTQTLEAQQKVFEQAFAVLFQSGGPVHLNLPFEEPLYATQTTTEPLILSPAARKSMDLADHWDQFQSVWQQSARVMVLVGVDLQGATHQTAVDWLAEQPHVLVFTENTSNIHHPQVIASIDQFIGPIEISDQSAALMTDLQPDLLITWGGPVVSKKIKQFLRTHAPKHHWHLGETPAFDTYFCGVQTLPIPVEDLVDRWIKIAHQPTSSYGAIWQERYTGMTRVAIDYRAQMPFSDFWVYHQLMQSLDRPYTLQWANSSVIRYAQLIQQPKHITAYCNRGTSGIEGSSSTAVGAALVSENPTILVTGDLSFFYDSNAWWNNVLRPDFRILLVNNGGGGIFRILPQAIDMPGFTQHVETAHQRSADTLCAAYHIGYLSARDAVEFSHAVQQWLGPSTRPQLLEVFTDPKTNDQTLKDYFTTLAKFIGL